MAAPTPYLTFPGTARDALEFYRGVFGGEIELHTFEEFERADGPSDAISRGRLSGPVDLYAADAAEAPDADGPGADGGSPDGTVASAGIPPTGPSGLVLSLLGAAEPSTLRTWYARLAADGEVIDELRRRPWGGSDGRVRDRYGVSWLIGYEHGTRAGETDDGFDLTQDWRV
jgi:PhnB protein